MVCSNDGAFAPENLVEHEVTRNLVQTFHRLASGGYRLNLRSSHPLPSGGQRNINLHRLATGGYPPEFSDVTVFRL